MTQPIGQLREISRGSGDRLIRVMAANPKGSGFHASTFSESDVQSVDEVGEDQSTLVLRSGAAIPVALSYEDLEQKVYSPNIRTDDSSVLDLRAVTGCVASKAARGMDRALPPSGGSSDAGASKPSSHACASNQSSDASSSLASEPGDKQPDDASRVSHRATHASEPPIGAVMKDGTVYAGISPNNGNPMYATPADVPVTMTFNEAAEYAKNLNLEKYLGHDDWRVPTKAELNVLFNNRAAVGGFNVSFSFAGCYWSAEPHDRWSAWMQRFCNGEQHSDWGKATYSSVRLVRSPNLIGNQP